MVHGLAMADRERVGRDDSPTASMVDAQAARSGGGGVAGRRGYDAAKRVVGRKRHASWTPMDACCWPLSRPPI